jgi:outer membrane translocation and assembly module TamA
MVATPLAPPRDDRATRDSLRAVLPALGEPPAWTGGGYPGAFAAAPDTIKPLPSTVSLQDRGGPFALPDSILSQAPTQYRPGLSLDFAGSQLIAATGYGFAGTAQFYFSDFLRNHSLYLATDLFGGSLEETNALLIYSYLPRRWDLTAGMFHFNNYYSGRTTTLGEQLSAPRLFSERNFGALASAAYPFDRFRRVEFNFTQTFVERKFFEQDIFGDYVVTGREYRSVSSPAVSLISDNALWGYYGPVNGHRTNLTYSPAFPWFDNALAYQTLLLDSRSYWNLTHGYSFATRWLGGVSAGRDPQVFRVGGFSTLRGYSNFDLLGSRIAIATTEIRFPFIQQLGVVGPLPLGFFNLRGAAFCDAGIIWPSDERLRWEPLRTAVLPENGYAIGFGTGVRSALSFMLLKLDVAWGTDLTGTSRPRWYFSIGPEF